MIAISYFWIPDHEFDMGIFDTQEEAKKWLITELVDNRYIREWYDDNTERYYETRAEIRECLEKETLEDIVKYSQIEGEIHIMMKTMKQ